MSNIGEGLTLEQCLEILRVTQKSNLPDRAEFFLEHTTDLIPAIEHRYTLTVIEGREFTIEYREDLIFIHPIEDYKFVPCAWFNINWLVKGLDAA